VLRATKEAGRGALDAVTTTAGVVVKSTAEFGGDLKLAAEGIVEGAIAGAKDLRLNVGEAASAAANSALKAASEISTTAREQVHGAVAGTIAGVKVVLGDEEARSRDAAKSKPARNPRTVQKSGHGRSTGKAAP